MKNKKPSIRTMFLLCAMTLCLAGCGMASESGLAEPDQTQADYMIQSATGLFGSLAELNGSENEAQARQIPIINKGLDSFQMAEEDLGDLSLTEITDIEVKTLSEHNYEVSFRVPGTEHDALVSTLFEEGFNETTGQFYLEPTGITTNVDFSFGELIQQAALNTVLGMGTTFLVLILLSVVISLFSLLNKAQQKSNQTQETPKADAPAAKTAVAETPMVVPAAEPVNSETRVAPAAETAADPAFAAACAGAMAAAGCLQSEPSGGDLVAVISAAICAASQAASPEDFVVRSIRPRSRKGWRR